MHAVVVARAHTLARPFNLYKYSLPMLDRMHQFKYVREMFSQFDRCIWLVECGACIGASFVRRHRSMRKTWGHTLVISDKYLILLFYIREWIFNNIVNDTAKWDDDGGAGAQSSRAVPWPIVTDACAVCSCVRVPCGCISILIVVVIFAQSR